VGEISNPPKVFARTSGPLKRQFSQKAKMKDVESQISFTQLYYRNEKVNERGWGMGVRAVRDEREGVGGGQGDCEKPSQSRS
jgi:hypothetical protein